MADLLSVDRTPIDESLESLAQNRVERLLDVEVQDAVCKSKGNTVFEALYRSCFTGFPFNKVWSKG